MANRVPLIVDTSTLQIKELPAGDSLDLTNSGIVNAGVITATSFSGNIGGTPTLGTGVTVTTSGLHVTGVVTATSGFSGDVTGDLTGNITGTPTLGTGVTVTTSGMNVSGVLTATSFSGDGSGLTNTGATLSAASGSQRLVVSSLTSGVMTTAATDADLAWNASTNTLSATNVTIGGTLTYQDVTNIDSLGIVTARNGLRVTAGGINVTAGVSTFSGSTVFKAHGTFEDNKQLRIGTGPDIVFYHDQSNTRLTQNSTAAGDLIFDTSDGATTIAKFLKGTKAVELYFGGASKIETRTDGAAVVGILTASGLNVVTGVSTFAGAIDANSTLDVASTSVFNNDVTFTGATKSIVWDKSDQQLEINGDNSNVAKVAFGDSHDLQIYKGASSGNAFIHNAAGTLNITQNSGTIKIDKNTGDEMAHFNVGGSVQLFHNSSERFATTDDGADISGTASLKIPVGTTAQRNGSPADGDIRYNSDLNSYEGYGNSAWGGLGGGTEIDVSVSSTSATNLTTFAKASYRSASLRIQIVQGSAYQVGRYLMIHDGTTATIVEEAAIATGSMLGTISAAINSANAEIKVTMGSASSATVTTIIDKITV